MELSDALSIAYAGALPDEVVERLGRLAQLRTKVKQAEQRLVLAIFSSANQFVVQAAAIDLAEANALLAQESGQ